MMSNSVLETPVVYSSEQLALLFEELERVKRDRDTLYEQNQKLTRHLEAKSGLIDATDEENRTLSARLSQIREICAIPHEKLGPYDKLAWITAYDLTTYSAGKHGGPDEKELVNYSKWTQAVGGGKNTVTAAAARLETMGVISRERIDCGDKLTHYSQSVNPDALKTFQQRAEAKPDRPHNGGDKRCPQCGNFCKNRKRFINTYECETCGIDFDQEMNPLDHAMLTPVASVPVPVPEPEPIQITMPDEETITRAFGKGRMGRVWE